MQASGPLFATTRGLRPNEGLTIVAMWPKGFIMPRGRVRRGRAAAPANYMNDDGRSGWSPAEHLLSKDLPNNGLPALLAVLGLTLLIVYYYFIWAKVGRDPPGRIDHP